MLQRYLCLRRFFTTSNLCFKESWKWRSNYFNDFFNKQNFGEIRNQRPEPCFSCNDKGATDAFWTQRIAVSDRQNRSLRKKAVIQSQIDLEKAILTASIFDDEENQLTNKKAFKKDTSNDKVDFSANKLFHPTKPFYKVGQPLPIKLRIGNYGSSLLSRKYFDSVTHILRATMPVEQQLALKRWEARMIEELGPAGFEQLSKENLARGKRLHVLIQHYFEQQTYQTGDFDDLLWISVRSFVEENLFNKNVSCDSFDGSFYALESLVVHPELAYLGFVDFASICRWNDNDTSLVLIDWKTSVKDKMTLSSTYDNPIQVAAYVGALNYDSHYPLQIKEAVIAVAYTDGRKATILRMNKVELKLYWQHWLKRLALYRSFQEYNRTMNSTDNTILETHSNSPSPHYDTFIEDSIT